MNTLPTDIVRIIMFLLPFEDVLKWCNHSPIIDRVVCTENFWQKKIRQDILKFDWISSEDHPAYLVPDSSSGTTWYDTAQDIRYNGEYYAGWSTYCDCTVCS